MSQEAISASSKYWDNKQISLTENTKKNIMKKAFMLDAETMFAQYQLAGEDAVNAAKQNNITEEQLVQNPNTYTFIGMSAITDLEANSSKESRVNAVVNLTKLGYTNLFDSGTHNFILPPSEEPVEEEKPKEPAKPEPEPEQESRYQYLRRTRPAPQEQQVQEQPQEPEPSYNEGPSPKASLSGAARFIPNKVRQYLPQGNPNRMTPARVSPATRSIRPEPRPVANPTTRFAPQRTQTVQRSSISSQPRPLLNAGMAAKLGGRGINPVQQAKPTVQRIAPRAKFGFKR